jgi:hypothetical protein
VVIKLVSLIVPLRMTAEELEVGDLALHGEVAIDMTRDESGFEVNGHKVPGPAHVPVGAGELN